MGKIFGILTSSTWESREEGKGTYLMLSLMTAQLHRMAVAVAIPTLPSHHSIFWLDDYGVSEWKASVAIQ